MPETIDIDPARPHTSGFLAAKKIFAKTTPTGIHHVEMSPTMWHAILDERLKKRAGFYSPEAVKAMREDRRFYLFDVLVEIHDDCTRMRWVPNPPTEENDHARP